MTHQQNISNVYTTTISSQLMLGGVEINTQTHVSCTDSIEFKHNQEQGMDTQENDFSSNEVTHQLVRAQIELATEPILRQVEKVCALLTERDGLGTAGISEAAGSRRGETPASSSDNRSFLNTFSQIPIFQSFNKRLMLPLFY